MELFLRGLLFGLFLAFLLGPIFVVTINLSIQHGKKAGFLAVLGVWLSDIIILTLCYLFVSRISSIIENEHFRFYMALGGGIILSIIGLVNMWKKAHFDVRAFAQKVKLKDAMEYLTKGILVNTVNPFTFFFWLTVMTTEVIGKSLSTSEAIVFLSAIMISIITTDSLKVILADMIRKRMKANHFNIFVKIAGLGLLAFGIYFIYYALYH